MVDCVRELDLCLLDALEACTEEERFFMPAMPSDDVLWTLLGCFEGAVTGALRDLRSRPVERVRRLRVPYQTV